MQAQNPIKARDALILGGNLAALMITGFAVTLCVTLFYQPVFFGRAQRAAARKAQVEA